MHPKIDGELWEHCADRREKERRWALHEGDLEAVVLALGEETRIQHAPRGEVESDP